MIGKHFLVKSLSNHRVKRHYTISNCLAHKAYQAYVQALQSGKDSARFPADLLQEKPTNMLTITSKNYKQANGVSMRLNESTVDNYEIQGPMGKGLGIERSGTHVAYTAGTGILVFLDLVAYLIRRNLGLMSESEAAQIDDKDFKFIFYASFPSKEEGIALDMCEGLGALCKQHSIANFEFHLRLSNQSKERWNNDFIEKSLKPHSGNLKKVWVCGPPKMNEDFDKCLGKLAAGGLIDKLKIDIM